MTVEIIIHGLQHTRLCWKKTGSWSQHMEWITGPDACHRQCAIKPYGVISLTRQANYTRWHIRIRLSKSHLFCHEIRPLIELISLGFNGRINKMTSDRLWYFEVDVSGWSGNGEGSSRPWELSDASRSDWWLGLVLDPDAGPWSV